MKVENQIYAIHDQSLNTRSGCASVLKTCLFKISISDSVSNNKYKYLSVSAKKKLSVLSLGCKSTSVTSSYSPYPNAVLQYFSID
mmetsp:Transcript_6170/g.7632  ORF Transcript_6170/g.7632 Transcript_6170/m.7632 type:complete len:85 (-) Transcript_6170:648-902(-)